MLPDTGRGGPSRHWPPIHREGEPRHLLVEGLPARAGVVQVVFQGLGAGALGGTLDEALPQPVHILMLDLQGFDLFLLEHLCFKEQ